MTEPPPRDDADLFDEAGYLRLYPPLAEAMMRGEVDTPWGHYNAHGRREGRLPNDVDPAFYLTAYPEIARDLGRDPTPNDAAWHFITLGRARGYRPNEHAPRAVNGAAPVSPFGGFWIDQAIALDLIQGQRDLGRIGRRDEAMLRTLALDGFAAFDQQPDKDAVRDAALVVSQAFTGLFPDLLFASRAWDAQPEQWRPELTEQAVVALDPHMVCGKLRALMLDKAIINFLSILFDAPPKLTASEAALRLTSAPERDVASHAYSLPLQFAAVTFDLEGSDDGAILIWPGSHRLQDLPWDHTNLTLSEARRTDAPQLEQAIAGRENLVRSLAAGSEPRHIGTRLGARMVRHPNLVHALAAPEPTAQRRSMTAWYCPSHVAPCYQETIPIRIHMGSGVTFCSRVYPSLDPID